MSSFPHVNDIKWCLSLNSDRNTESWWPVTEKPRFMEWVTCLVGQQLLRIKPSEKTKTTWRKTSKTTAYKPDTLPSWPSLLRRTPGTRRSNSSTLWLTHLLIPARNPSTTISLRLTMKSHGCRLETLSSFHQKTRSILQVDWPNWYLSKKKTGKQPSYLKDSHSIDNQI